MDKVDLKKRLRHLYAAPFGDFSVVEVPPLTYFMVDGHGDPNLEPAYRQAVEALYAAAYTLKFMSRDELGTDYVVPPLEGLWWAADMADFAARRKQRWSWTMMIMVPDFVPAPVAVRAVAKAAVKKPLAALGRIRIATLHEGLAVQTLHIGPYDDEGPVLETMHGSFLPSKGLVETGHHHEIYLGDPRRSAPERLRTILRQPVKTAA